MSRIVLSMALMLLLQACGLGEDKNAARPAPLPLTPETKSAAEPRPAAKESTERLFQNQFDAEAVYFLSQKNGTPEALSVLIKRVSQDGTQYSRWLFNCNDHTAQNLGVAASIQALDVAANSMPSKSQHYETASKLGAIATTVCQ
jgi:hypothetical protein